MRLGRNVVTVTNSSGTEKSFFTMTSAGSFGMSQEIGELEDALDEPDDLVELPSERGGLSPALSSSNGGNAKEQIKGI